MAEARELWFFVFFFRMLQTTAAFQSALGAYRAVQARKQLRLSCSGQRAAGITVMAARIQAKERQAGQVIVKA